MATIFTDEGLDKLMGIVPKNGTNVTSLYIGLFTGLTGSTVPARTATGGASPAGWTEVSGTSYARVQILAASWGAQATNGNGRKSTAGQVTFPTAGGAWTAADGFFLATNSASGAGDVTIYFANFDSGLIRTLATGDVIKVTPAIQFSGA
jgi:hypothetical protein